MSNKELFKFPNGLNKLQQQADDYLAKMSNSLSIRPIKVTIGSFVEFYLQEGKPIEDYNTEDYSRFFALRVRKRQSFSSNKSILLSFLSAYQYDTQQLKETEYKQKDLVFVKDFMSLRNSILKEKSDNGYQDTFLGKCDAFTSAEMVIYLAWIGFPKANIIDLKKSDIDFKSGVIHFGGQDYPFEDYDALPMLFFIYANCSYFYCINNKGITRQFDYCSDRFIRSARLNNNPRVLVNRVFEKYPSLINYDNVFISGIFDRAYKKYQSGETFKHYNEVNGYFGYCPKSRSATTLFLADWQDYLKWKQK